MPRTARGATVASWPTKPSPPLRSLGGWAPQAVLTRNRATRPHDSGGVGAFSLSRCGCVGAWLLRIHVHRERHARVRALASDRLDRAPDGGDRGVALGR